MDWWIGGLVDQWILYIGLVDIRYLIGGLVDLTHARLLAPEGPADYFD